MSWSYVDIRSFSGSPIRLVRPWSDRWSCQKLGVIWTKILCHSGGPLYVGADPRIRVMGVEGPDDFGRIVV